MSQEKVSDEPILVQKQLKPLNKAGDTHSTPDFGKYGFKPGQSSNPGGKPIGARNRLQGDFMRALSEDFAVHGKTAIIACRTEKPDVYVKVIATLMLRELEVKRPLEGITDEELEAGIALLQEYLKAARSLH